ncbi:aldehyde ferredoxin oxidoreductase C-terminal domain-containing protein [uncultured Sphaerochaeta sp.]|uniref:aldehyde ferredoxin oxidoreductase C-terminal domain-containing protein n=1 Tax=uncultured Sphaerochaeta sp. TaxID=886478 RepID=UPI002A0A4064|nr:aldehyde ferredoxin oxidoreductase C-terminal domain-containing protein [uncultured Sphaerochaeta sp.]
MEHKQPITFPYRQRYFLLVDVSQETWQKVPLGEEESKSLLGGRFLALGLWDKYAHYDNLDSQAYESGNPIVIAAGSACDTSLACCDSYTLVTRSLLTKRLSVNFCNGALAKVLYGCGYSAIVIIGRFRRLSGLSVDFQSVLFSNAEKFHDYTTSDMASQFPGNTSIALGPAGEHQVPYASIWIDGSNTGRGGVGTIFGLKNIKYITFSSSISGRGAYDPKRLGTAMHHYQRAFKHSKVANMIAQEGSVTLINQANSLGWAAVDDFSLRSDGRLWALASYPRDYDLEPVEQGCAQCPLKTVSSKKGPLPDFSLALALGANLELFDYRSVSDLMQRCSLLGLDYYSVGAIFAWARKTRGLGTLPFLPDLGKATSAQPYLHLLDSIAYKKGTGEQLANTLDALVLQYGGQEYAYQVNGQALAPFDVRALPAQALLTSLGDDTVVIPELLKGVHYHRGQERKIAKWAVFCQDYRYAMESLGLCPWFSLPFFDGPLFLQPCKLYTDRAFSFLASLASATEGYEVTAKQMAAWGKKAWALQMKIDQLLVEEELVANLPEQMLVNSTSNHPRARVVPLARLLDAYYVLRGLK